MIEKEPEFIDTPIHVFLYEEPNIGPVLLMTFFNGMRDAIDMVVKWLNDSVFSYLDTVTVTLVDTDALTPARLDRRFEDQGDRGSPSGGPQPPYTEQSEGT